MSQQVTTAHNDGAFTLPQLKTNTRYYEYLKFKEGHLLLNDVQVPPETTYIALKIVATGRMFFPDGGPPETCDAEEIDAMNAKIPEADWPLDLNNKPTQPWKLYYDVYMVNPTDGSSYLFSNCTIGHSIAARRLSNQVDSMRDLHGANVLPAVRVTAKPMKTSFGTRARPHFEVVKWEGMPDKPRTASEIVNDRMPWDDPIPEDL